jgi:diguanylate cyclase (GGDEF)-like protein
MPKSPTSSNALLQVYEDELIVGDLQRRVLNFATTTVAALSGTLSLLFLYHALGYLEFPAFEMVGTGTQVNAAIGLALFALTSVAVRVLNSKSASLHLSRLMTVLLALVVVNFVPATGVQYVMPQAIWLPVLFGAATVSGTWAGITAVGTLLALAIRYSDAPVFHNPASVFVTIAIFVLILSLRWLYDAGLRAVARSHQRVLTTLRVDTLTGLPNRTRLMELLSEQQSGGDGFSGIAVARFDIDGFGAICDSIGATAGDELLVQVAEQLRTAFSTSLRCARVGADDFAVILPAPKGPQEAELRADEILRKLGEARTLGDLTLRLTFKAGVAVGGASAGETPEGILHRADLALTEAKRTGQRCIMSLPATIAAPPSRRRFDIAQLLFGATTRGEFHLVYQPIIELETGRIAKAEALLRWDHPQLGSVSPGEFIAVAEEVGAIHEIGDWVAAEAAKQAVHLRAAGHPDFQMSINRSPVQFRADSDEEPVCLRTFRALGLPPGSIVLEITEGVLLDGRDANRDRLARLRRAGIGLSLDDFGTGYASLAQLHAFEIDIVKIDRRFVSGLAEGNREQALCAGIISLAHSLGMKVTAEGVETIEQRDLLVGLGCDYGQGWLFGRPLPAEAFEAALNSQQQIG